MLKRIEITNFESHQHTVIDDLSDGLNMFMGQSNVGKSGIVRALELAAYNQFDPKSLRTGETKCEVFVETDKGTVKVIRGPKINYWEVHPIGENLQTFEKVGVQIVPEAARVMGLNIVKLGDVDIPVNIMDQLESHFMLSSLAGKDASGSMRAQVIDEISGLSGIEGVIKSVSLDNSRAGKKISETEAKMKETQSQMHDEAALTKEQAILVEAEDELKVYEGGVKAFNDAQQLLGEFNKLTEQLEIAETALNAIPDIDAAKVEFDKADVLINKKTEAEELFGTGISLISDIDDVDARLALIPDTDDALVSLDRAKKAIDKVNKANSLLSDYQKIAEHTAELNANMEAFEQMDDPTRHMEAAKTALEQLKRAKDMLEAIKALRGQVSLVEGRLKGNELSLKKAEADRDMVLSQVKVCPLTLKPVSKQCIEEAKV